MSDSQSPNNSVLPSEKVNFAEQPLTIDEQQLIAAFRAKDKARVWSIAFDKAILTKPESDVADQLAVFILGSMALRYSEFADLFKNDHEWLGLMLQDVAAAIREGLPRLDIRELQNIHAGK